jgi:threonine dehydrogenase-like Zn-dependent dehydrogenase
VFEPGGALGELTAGGGVDVALEFVGTPDTVDAAVRSLADGGRAVAVGMGPGPIKGGHLITFVARERELVGALGAEPGEVVAALELLAGGTLALDHLIGEEIPLVDVADGLERLHRGTAAGARIVVDVAGLS